MFYISVKLKLMIHKTCWFAITLECYAKNVTPNSANKVLHMSFIDFSRSNTFETGHTTKQLNNFSINVISIEVIFRTILTTMATVVNSRKNKATNLISCNLTATNS